MTRRVSIATKSALIAFGCSIALAASCAAAFAAAPPIRLSATNQIPGCVTPERLDAFLERQLTERGHRLRPPFRNIAKFYRQHGEQFRVRWDYAFFQMALETNFLSFRRGDGKPGDVSPTQNNFAGLGTTGGGIPGDAYPDVSTGVLAQIQHLVVYSGERVRNPVGHRTRLKQDVILQSIARISRQRPVTFADLARRWAADRQYGRSIERLANLFMTDHCKPPARRLQQATAPLPVIAPPASKPVMAPQTATHSSPPAPVPNRRAPLASPPPAAAVQPAGRATIAPAPPRPAAPAAPLPLAAVTSQSQFEQPSTGPAKTCTVQIASFGGDRAVLIESMADQSVRLTALNVQPGFEIAMAANFIEAHAPNGRTIGAFSSRDEALAKAHELCRRRIAAAR